MMFEWTPCNVCTSPVLVACSLRGALSPTLVQTAVNIMFEWTPCNVCTSPVLVGVELELSKRVVWDALSLTLMQIAVQCNV